MNTNELLEDIYSGLFKLNKVVTCPLVPKEVPGIVAADAIAANDCLGTIFTIRVPKWGVLTSATYFDFDDEGLQTDFEIFKTSFTQIAHNAAWAPSDADMLNFITELAFAVGDDHINSYTFELTNIGKLYTAPEGFLHIQTVGRGAHNIAAGAMPRLQLQIQSFDTDFAES